jgi:hypothetical protein
MGKIKERKNVMKDEDTKEIIPHRIVKFCF